MKREAASRNYDRLAPFYDFFDRCLSQPIAGLAALRDQTVARLELQPGDRVLDIGCGTGLNRGRLVDAVGPTGRVVGLDYSAGMLRQARARVLRERWENVELLRGDAAELKGVPAPFDAALSTWALGIVEDLPSALRPARGHAGAAPWRATRGARPTPHLPVRMLPPNGRGSHPPCAAAMVGCRRP